MCIFLDLEPWNGYWSGTPQAAVIFGQELRRLAPNLRRVHRLDFQTERRTDAGRGRIARLTRLT